MKKNFLIILFFSLLIQFACPFGVYSQPSITWQRLYNGSSYRDNEAYSVCNADNSSFYIAGIIADSLLSTRYNYVIKIDAYSNVIWSKIILTHGGNGYIYSIAMTNDSGCIFTGDGAAPYTIRLNKFGDVVWNKYYDTLFYVINNDIKKTNDQNFIACGRELDFDKGYIMKINSSGNFVWHIVLDDGIYILKSVETLANNSYLITGRYALNFNDSTKGVIINIDTSGNIIWKKIYQYNHFNSEFNFIKKLDNYFIVAGDYIDSSSKSHVFIGKFDFNGNFYWSKSFSSLKSEQIDKFNVINNNKFVHTSYFWSYYSYDTSYVRIIISDSSGNILHEKRILSNETAPSMWLDGIQPVTNGDILFAGSNHFPGLRDNVYAMRTDSTLNYPNNLFGINKNNNNVVKHFNLSQNYPNPFNPSTKINYQIPITGFVNITLYDVLGRKVVELVNEKQNAGTYEVEWNGTNFASGIYFYKLETETSSGLNFTETKKMVLMK